MLLKITDNAEIILYYNFTAPGNTAKVTLSPKIFHWTLDESKVGGNANYPGLKLSLLDEKSTLETVTKAIINPQAVETVKTMSGNLDNNKETLELVSTVAIGLSIMSAGAPSGPIISLIKLFKLFFRLRLINVYFGRLLSEFIKMIGSSFSKGYLLDSLAEVEQAMFMDTRGKLTKYKVPIFANFIIGGKLIMYLVSRNYAL